MIVLGGDCRRTPAVSPLSTKQAFQSFNDFVRKKVLKSLNLLIKLIKTPFIKLLYSIILTFTAKTLRAPHFGLVVGRLIKTH